ncbi:MAG: hypothetical protein H6560_13125 [Lewinellaceae bacterium]|nr:hypothetical protein [Lewinellaceae bacterium]
MKLKHRITIIQKEALKIIKENFELRRKLVDKRYELEYTQSLLNNINRDFAEIRHTEKYSKLFLLNLKEIMSKTWKQKENQILIYNTITP